MTFEPWFIVLDVHTSPSWVTSRLQIEVLRLNRQQLFDTLRASSDNQPELPVPHCRSHESQKVHYDELGQMRKTGLGSDGRLIFVEFQ